MDMQQWKERPRDWIFTGNPEDVNAEIRAHMARRDLHHNEVADILGLKRQAFARRLHGETPWHYSELRKLAISWNILPLDLAGSVPEIGVSRMYSSNHP